MTYDRKALMLGDQSNILMYARLGLRIGDTKQI